MWDNVPMAVRKGAEVVYQQPNPHSTTIIMISDQALQSFDLSWGGSSTPLRFVVSVISLRNHGTTHISHLRGRPRREFRCL